MRRNDQRNGTGRRRTFRSTPVVIRGLALVTLIWLAGCGQASVQRVQTARPGTTPNIYLGLDRICAYRSDTGQLGTCYNATSNASSFAVVDRVVYATVGNTIVAIRTSDGTSMWHYVAADSFTTAPTVANGIVYVGTSRPKNASPGGAVYAIRANDGGLLWAQQTRGAISTTPVLGEGTVYISSSEDTSTVDERDYVYALRQADGGIAWKSLLDGQVRSSLVHDTANIFVGTITGSVYALRASDGTSLWRYQTDDEVLQPAAVTPQAIYLCTLSGYVYALDRSRGAQQWRSFTGCHGAAPAVENGYIFAGSETPDATGNSLFALRASDGATIWKQALPGSVAPPTVEQGRLYVEAVKTTFKPCCPPGPAYLIAMDTGTGAQLWQTQVGETRALVNVIVGL